MSPSIRSRVYERAWPDSNGRPAGSKPVRGGGVISAWILGNPWSPAYLREVRALQWRDYDRAEQTLQLSPEHSKNSHGRVLLLVGELANIIARRLEARRIVRSSFTATACRSVTSASPGSAPVQRSDWPVV